MDLSQRVSVVGAADQCVACLRDRVYFAVVVFDVAVVPETNIHKGLMREVDEY